RGHRGQPGPSLLANRRPARPLLPSRVGRVPGGAPRPAPKRRADAGPRARRRAARARGAVGGGRGGGAGGGAAGRRGPALRRLPGLVRDDALGLLPGLRRRAGGADPARRVLRIRRARAGRTRHVDARQEFVGGIGDLFGPYALAVGATLLVLYLLHGAAFLA